MSALTAAATLAELSGWTLTNLQTQKLLYLAQMFHIGETDQPIFSEDFEAWKLGPVIPKVYRAAKMYGSEPVTFPVTQARLPEGTGRNMLHRVLKLPDISGWKLVTITHWDKGAWAKNYDESTDHCVIPKSDIRAEYAARLRVLKQRKG